MAFKLVIKPIVFADTDEAVGYYEMKLKGLGNRFYISFLSTIDNIQTNPFTTSYFKKPVRRRLIVGFPYKVYYLVLNETIFIIGVSHAKRSNAFVKKRLRLLE